MIMAHHLILQAEPFNLQMGQTALTALAWFGWGWDVFGSTCFQVWSSTGEGGFDRWVDRASRNGQIIPKNPGRFIAPKGFGHCSWVLCVEVSLCLLQAWTSNGPAVAAAGEIWLMHVDRFPHCKPLEQLSKTRLPQQNTMGNPWKSPIFVVCQRTTCSPSGFLEELVALFPVLFSLTMASRNVCAMQAFSASAIHQSRSDFCRFLNH